MLVDGWDGGMSALERELFLETLRRMYERVRFADTAAGTEMLRELSSVCDSLKVAGRFAPHTEL